MKDYVHGYSEREAIRLVDQASSVRDLFHHDTTYPPRSLVLEAGCGVGAQTVTLATNCPDATIVAADIAADSLGKAKAIVEEERHNNVHFERADVFALPHSEETFDHVWVCHLLEHLSRPVDALERLGRVLRADGTMTVIEGDHGSCYFHPETKDALRAWRSLIRVQASLGGNSLIGRELFPVLSRAGFSGIRVSPRMVYMDRSKPMLMDGFVRRTIIPMVEGVREMALQMGLLDESGWDRGIRDLHAVADRDDGTFCYTFFKAVASK
jgi:SAM-dependent methyltransferase